MTLRLPIEVMPLQIGHDFEDFPDSDPTNAFIRPPEMCSSSMCTISQ